MEYTAHRLGMSDVFVGVFIVAVVGNAAEHSTAVIVALKNKMDLAVNIAVGSSLQVALLVAPTLVFVSYAFGKPLDLLFTTFEIAAIVLSVAVVTLIASDGESNWMEGVLLLAVYAISASRFIRCRPEAIYWEVPEIIFTPTVSLSESWILIRCPFASSRINKSGSKYPFDSIDSQAKTL